MKVTSIETFRIEVTREEARRLASVLSETVDAADKVKSPDLSPADRALADEICRLLTEMP